MKKRTTPFTPDRRLFLKGAAAAGGVTALAAVSASGLNDSDTADNTDPGTAAGPASRGYRETAHIREYYRTLRS